MGISSSFNKLNLTIAQLETVLDEHSIVAVTDIEGKIVYVNKKFCEISKYSEDELLGNNHRMLKSDYHSEEFFKKLWNTILSGKTWQGELKNRAKDGTHYWVKTVIMPLFDEQKNIKNFIAIRTDITREKEITEKLLKVENQLKLQNQNLIEEIQKKSDEIIKSARLATIGTMSSRIAHDLKNPLTIMHTYAEMLTPQILTKLDMKDREKWLRLQNSILDMNRIIEDVLDFARSTELKKQTHSLLRILKLSLNNIRHSFGVHINIPNDDVLISCDDRKIEAVFSNIIGNAVAALDDSGEINVVFKEQNGEIRIDISDSGPGIPDDIAHKIFEPLFTTKKTGTGLGLVICKSIVEQHGGHLSFSTKPTTFTIIIPKN